MHHWPIFIGMLSLLHLLNKSPARCGLWSNCLTGIVLELELSACSYFEACALWVIKAVYNAVTSSGIRTFLFSFLRSTLPPGLKSSRFYSKGVWFYGCARSFLRTWCFSDRASWIDYILITNLMHWLLFIPKILFSSTCIEEYPTWNKKTEG